MSFTSVDLPEPETPVTTVRTPRGKETSIFLKLLARAPSTERNFPLGDRREEGTGMRRDRERYRPVGDSLALACLFRCPQANRYPPCLWDPGPRCMKHPGRRVLSS